jgi:hypothetical protein
MARGNPKSLKMRSNTVNAYLFLSGGERLAANQIAVTIRGGFGRFRAVQSACVTCVKTIKIDREGQRFSDWRSYASFSSFENGAPPRCDPFAGVESLFHQAPWRRLDLDPTSVRARAQAGRSGAQWAPAVNQ